MKKKITYWPIKVYARQITTATTAGGAKNSLQFAGFGIRGVRSHAHASAHT